MQPNDDNLPENNIPEMGSVAPSQSPVEPEMEQPQPMGQPAVPPPVSPAMDVEPPEAPQPEPITSPASAEAAPSDQPVSFQPSVNGEQPQPIQSVPAEPEKHVGFFGKLFGKK